MKQTIAQRGFVTIATGNTYYYAIAKNLLLSYRRHASVKYPFAIICDRKNDYTDSFDHQIVISDPANSYMDKLKLFRELPFDETIFIDADSLAFGDLDAWWDLFNSADDFSVFGYAWSDLSCGRGWFDPKGMGEYRDKISYIPDFNGGVYYLRNTETCKKVFETAVNCAEHWEKYSFLGFRSAADEPVLALAMTVYGCKPLDLREIVFAPKNDRLDADIVQPRCRYQFHPNQYKDVRLIHFSSYLTRKSLYRFEVEKMKRIRNWENLSFTENILYKHKLRRFFLRYYDFLSFCFRIKRKLKKMIQTNKRKNNQ